MLAKSLLWISLVALVAAAAFTLACGSSNSNAVAPCTGSYNVVGDWNLTYNNTSGVGGVIDTTGQALFFDQFGNVVDYPTITGACSFTGNATLYEASGDTAYTIQGNVTSTTSISGSVSNSTGNTSFSISPMSPAPLTGSVTALSGPLLAQLANDPNGDQWEVTVTPTNTGASMTFSGPNVANTCSISGTLTQEAATSANLNVFSASISFSGSSCFYATIAGLGLESDSDYLDYNNGSNASSVPYLYVIASGAPAVLELYQNTAAARRSQHRQPGGQGFRF